MFKSAIKAINDSLEPKKKPKYGGVNRPLQITGAKARSV